MNTLEMSVFIEFLFVEKMNMNNGVAVKSRVDPRFHLGHTKKAGISGTGHIPHLIDVLFFQLHLTQLPR